MKIYMVCALYSLILLSQPSLSVLAKKQQETTTQPCPASNKYPDNPETVLADYVIELISKTTSDENDPLLQEAKKLKTPEGQQELRKYLKEKIENGAEDQKAYSFCLLLKQFAVALSKDNQDKIKARLSTGPMSKTKKCLPFFCIFRLCTC